MKRIFYNNKTPSWALALAIIISLLPPFVQAESFGPSTGAMWTADLCGFGNGFVGVNGGYGSDSKAAYATVSYGFSDLTEGRIKIGNAYPDFSDGRSFLFGVEAKYELFDYSDPKSNRPFDFSVGAMFEITYYENLHIKEYGLFSIFSIPFEYKSNITAFPYLRLNIRKEVASPKHRVDEGITITRLGGNLGLKAEPYDETEIYIEAQIDGNTGLFVGLAQKLF